MDSPAAKVLLQRFGNLRALLDARRDSGSLVRPCANSVFITPWGVMAGGPGGCYLSADAEHWTELRLWREDETGAADFLHAYWMGRYYGFIGKKD